MSTDNYNGGCASARSFTVQLLAGRFFIVFSTLMILGFIGAAYIFGLYSGDIKTSLGYDQTTLNLLSFFKDLGTYVSVHAGLLMEVAPPWVVLSVGGVVNFFGYFMIWLAVTNKISQPPVWLMCLYITIGANSLGFANTGGLVPCVQNFPENRGVVIGILKSYLGIGGAIMTQFYHALYGDNSNTSGVILIISWLPAAVSLLFAFSVRVLDVAGRNIKRDRKFFNDVLCMSLGLAGFIMVMIIVQKQNQLGIKMCSVLQLRGKNHSILQATFSVDMQILFLATICGIGGNLTTIDNLGQIGTSLGYPKKSISAFVSLVSIWQFLGRVMGGLISERLLDKYKWPRPACLSIVLFVSCIPHLLIAFNVPYGLYVASVIMGFCFGAEWTYLFTIISELFGLKHYGTLYNYGSLAAPLGSFIFNVRIAGHLYDREGLRQLKAQGLTRKHGEELHCYGVKCYQLAYFIITAATFVTALVSLILVARTRKFYKGDIYKRYQKKDSASTNVTLRGYSGKEDDEVN
uniref:Nodulin-like domain-containing protein n=1 Tax=Chenopodium quinoa TaxID=63459 RepID=A0A803NDR8_CHEQI